MTPIQRVLAIASRVHGNAVIKTTDVPSEAKLSVYSNDTHKPRYKVSVNAGRMKSRRGSLVDRGISEFADFGHFRKEVRFGSENSKVDFLLSGSDHAKLYLEVKSVTLLQQGRGLFPDTVTERGQKHLRELTQMVMQGNNAAIFFCVQHTGIKKVEIAKNLDPEYYDLMRIAINVGVKVLAYSTEIDEKGIKLNKPLPFQFNS